MANRSEQSTKIDSMNVDDALDMIVAKRKCSREDATEFAIKRTLKQLLAEEERSNKPDVKIKRVQKKADKLAKRSEEIAAKLAALKGENTPATETPATETPAPVTDVASETPAKPAKPRTR